MISKFVVHKPSNVPISWWGKTFKEPRTFEFQPGLNILWGRNGSGKSTLIKCLARLFHCEQSGFPVVTETSVGELFCQWRFSEESRHGAKLLLDALSLTHDGQGVRYFDPSHAVGLTGGGSAFDWDFGMDGIQNALFKGSSGQITMFRSNRVLRALLDKGATPPKVEYRIHASQVNSLWAERIHTVKSILTGNSEEGPPTILLDEPERSFDLPYQSMLWQFLRTIAKKNQVIVASHSLFALRIPEAHYVEMSPNYLKESLEVSRRLHEGWPTEPGKL